MEAPQWPRGRAAAVPAGPEDDADALFREAVDSGLGTSARTRLLYARAAALGHVRAAYYLGQIYEAGEGVAPDPALARRWYQLASAENGKARERLGELPADDQADAAIPTPLLAARREDGTVDLVWSPMDGQTTVVVEFAAAPDTAPRYRGEVAGSTLSLALPPDMDYWRVAPLHGEAAPTPWRKLNS